MRSTMCCFFLLLPLTSLASLQTCCEKNHKRRRAGLQQDLAHKRYRAVEGEIFMVPCLGQDSSQVGVMWSRTGEEGHLPFECGKPFTAKTQHSGRYTSRNQSFHLQVLERKGLGCFQPGESVRYLQWDQGGVIPCPGQNCSNNTDVIWYKMKDKGVQAVSEQRRNSCERSGQLEICWVYEWDDGVYFCDRQTTDSWIFRRSVNVTVVSSLTPTNPPRIWYPDGNSKEEVELGQPHTLECRIHFPIEGMRTLLHEVQWYMNYDMEGTTPVRMNSQQLATRNVAVVEVTETAVINEVTLQHLDSTYTCICTNSKGSSFGTVRLKQRHTVTWPSLVKYPIGPLLLVAGLLVISWVNWLELQLILRCYFHFGNHCKAEKEFDVFLSFMWPRASSQSAPGAEQEACSGSNLLHFEMSSSTHPPLEVLLPQVLEEEWGHRLCLLERDVLPGGAYTNDVVLAIQRSQMLICVLSAEYLSNTDAVFILESGLQALLYKSTPKLLLIWTNKATAAQIKPDPPLPMLVQRALKVLPSLDWTSGKSERRTSNFWRSLKKSLPRKRVCG